MMDITWQSVGRTPVDKPTKAYWFGQLEHLPFEAVEKAFDNWLKTSDELPTIKEILRACAPKEAFHVALKAPRNDEVCQAGLAKINSMISKSMNSKTDHKKWARDILANPAGLPDISIRFAREALEAKA